MWDPVGLDPTTKALDAGAAPDRCRRSRAFRSFKAEYYLGRMKVKTSITLSEDVLAELDRLAGPGSRSSIIEGILRAFLRRKAHDEAHARDRELLDEYAEVFNAEAIDVLDYQAALEPDV